MKTPTPMCNRSAAGISEGVSGQTGFRHMEGNSSPMPVLRQWQQRDHSRRNGRLVLGTWQGVYFCEFDGPRRRTFYVSVIAG
ncbi:MAG: YjbQ family protein [Ruminococcus callidus]